MINIDTVIDIVNNNLFAICIRDVRIFSSNSNELAELQGPSAI